MEREAAVIRVEVTADDIRDGKPQECSECPIALALARAYHQLHPNGQSRMTVSRLWVGCGGSMRRWPAEVAEQIADFLHTFDRPNTRSKARPFSFELDSSYFQDRT